MLDASDTPLSFHNMPLVPLWKKNTWMTLFVYINSNHSFSDYKAKPDWQFQLQNNDRRILTKTMLEITVNVYLFFDMKLLIYSFITYIYSIITLLSMLTSF